MSDTLRLALLNAGFLAVGQALLAGTGLVRDARSAFRLAGLAYLAGWAATGVALSFVLMAGVPFRAVTVLVLWAALAAAGLAAVRRVPASELQPAGAAAGGRAGRGLDLAERGVGLAAAAALVAYLVVELLSINGRRGSFHPDVWAMWLPKGETIFFFHGLDLGQGGFTSFAHPNYPPLVPSLDATTFAFLGRADVLLVGSQHWVVIVAFVAALAGLLSYRVRAAISFPCLLLLALLPAFHSMVGSGLGDETLMVEFVAAGLLGALWLRLGDVRLALLAGLFLSAAVLSKSEGLLLAVALGVVALACAARGRRRVPLALLGAAAVTRLAWWIWLVANDVPRGDDYRLSDALHPGYLADHADRLGPGIDGLLAALLGPGRFLVTVPIGLAAAALCIRLCPRVVAFLVGTGLLVLAGYAVIYWISPMEIHLYIDTSARRIVTPVGILFAGVLPLLLAERLAGGPSTAPSASPAPRLAA